MVEAKIRREKTKKERTKKEERKEKEKTEKRKNYRSKGDGRKMGDLMKRKKQQNLKKRPRNWFLKDFTSKSISLERK